MKKKHLLLSFFALFCSLTICLSVLCFSSKLVQSALSTQTSDINGSSTINLLQNIEGNSAIYVYSGVRSEGVQGEWSVSGDNVDESDMNKITIEQNTDAKCNDTCRLKWTPIDKNTVFNLTLKFTYNSNIYSKNIKFNILNTKDVFTKKFKIFSDSDNYTFSSTKSSDIDFSLKDSDDNPLYSKINWEIEYLNINVNDKLEFFNFEIKESSATFHFKSSNSYRWTCAGVYRIKISASFLNDGKPTLIDSKYISVSIKQDTSFFLPQEYIIFDIRKKDLTTTFYSAKYLTDYEFSSNNESPLDESTITLKLRDGSDLPTWLKFDYTNRRFYFIPKDVKVESKNPDIFITLTWNCPGFIPVGLSIQFIYDRMYITDESSNYQNEVTQFCLANGSKKKMHINHTSPSSMPAYPLVNDGYSYSFTGNEDDALIELSNKTDPVETLDITLKTNKQDNFSLTITRVDYLTAKNNRDIFPFINPDPSTLTVSTTITFNAALFVIEGPTQLFSSVDTEGYGVKNADGTYSNGEYKYTTKVAKNSQAIKVDKDNVEWSINNNNNEKPVINLTNITDFQNGYGDGSLQESVNINWNNTFSSADSSKNKMPDEFYYTITLKNKIDHSLLASLEVTLTSLELYSSSYIPSYLDEFFTYPGSSSTTNSKIAPVVYSGFLWDNLLFESSMRAITKWVWHNSDSSNYYRINFNDPDKSTTAATFHTAGLDISSDKYKDSEDITASVTCYVGSTPFILKRKLKVSSYKYDIIGEKVLLFDALTTTESPEYTCKKSSHYDNNTVNPSNIGYELVKADALHDDPPGGYFSTYITDSGKGTGKIKVKGSTTLNQGLYKFRLLAYEKISDGPKRYFASLDVSLFVAKISGSITNDYYTPYINDPSITVNSFFGKENWTTAEAKKNHEGDKDPLPNTDRSVDNQPYAAWSYYFMKNGTRLADESVIGLRRVKTTGDILANTWTFQYTDNSPFLDYSDNYSLVANLCIFSSNIPPSNPDAATSKIMISIPIHQDAQQAVFVDNNYTSIYLSPGTSKAIPVKHASTALANTNFKGNGIETVIDNQTNFENVYSNDTQIVNIAHPNLNVKVKAETKDFKNPAGTQSSAKLNFYANNSSGSQRTFTSMKNIRVGVARNISRETSWGLYSSDGMIKNAVMMGYVNASNQKCCHFELDIYACTTASNLNAYTDAYHKWTMDAVEGEGEKMIYSWDASHPDGDYHTGSFVKVYVSVSGGVAKYRMVCHPLGGDDNGDEFSYTL